MDLPHTLTFHADGTVTTPWSDRLALGELGRMRVERASSVEFNDATRSGDWGRSLRCNPEQVHFSHASRAVCLHWEHDYFNA